MRNILLLLGLLTGPLALGALFNGLFGTDRVALDAAGRLGVVLLFCVTGIGHFTQTQPMSQMLPPWVPARVAIIYATGLLEIAGAVGFLFPGFRYVAGVCLVTFLILSLPANIYSAFQRVPMGGHAEGPAYLLVRIPLQLLIIGWTWWFGIRAMST